MARRWHLVIRRSDCGIHVRASSVLCSASILLDHPYSVCVFHRMEEHWCLALSMEH